VIAARALAYASRFFVAVENLGFASSLKIFALYRLGIKRDSVIFARKLNRSIYFRGAADTGVLSHFFYPGFRIRDTPEHPVRFIIDAGANIGDETLRFRHFHSEAFIVALEPEEGNHRMLLRNIGQDERVAVIQAGLWSHQCSLSVVAGEQNHNEAFQVREAAASETGTISAVSVRSLMDRFGYADVDILKMDIEGAEYQVFSEYFESWIDRVKVFIFECPDHDHPGAAFRIFRALEGKPFDCYVQGECLVLIRRDTGWKVESNLFIPSLRRGEVTPPSARALSEQRG
jgi:FkbM family methyltransferase